MSSEEAASVWYAALPAEIRPRTHQKPAPSLEVYVRSKWRDGNQQQQQQQKRTWATKVDGKHLLLHNPPAEAQQKQQSSPQQSLSPGRRQRHGQHSPDGVAANLLKERQRLPAAAAVWDRFVPLHALWLEYIHDVVSDASGATELGARLVKADVHGALVCVCRALSSALVGLTGIVVKETQHTFTLVTPANQFRVIPKRDAVFTLRVSDTLVTLFGAHLLHRSADRASRKFKSKATVDLFGK